MLQLLSSSLSVAGNFVLSLALVLQKKFINVDNAWTICLYRWFVAIVIFQPLVVFTWKRDQEESKRRKTSPVYAILWILSMALYHYCVELCMVFIPASNAAAIVDSYAIVVSVVSPMVSEEKFRWSTVLGSVLGVCGLFVISQPAFLFGEGSQLNWEGILVALLANLSYAVNVLLSKKILSANLYFLNFVLYIILLATSSLSLIGDIRVFQLECGVSPFLVIGAMAAFVFGTLMLNFAYRFGDNGLQSVLGLCGVPLTYILEMILNGYRPNKYALIGGALVILALSSLLFADFKGCKQKEVNEEAVTALSFSAVRGNENVVSYGSVVERGPVIER